MYKRKMQSKRKRKWRKIGEELSHVRRERGRRENREKVERDRRTGKIYYIEMQTGFHSIRSFAPVRVSYQYQEMDSVCRLLVKEYRKEEQEEEKQEKKEEKQDQERRQVGGEGKQREEEELQGKERRGVGGEREREKKKVEEAEKSGGGG